MEISATAAITGPVPATGAGSSRSSRAGTAIPASSSPVSAARDAAVRGARCGARGAVRCAGRGGQPSWSAATSSSVRPEIRVIASERVLAAAREAFTTAGAGVSLDEIATRAGVGPGTVYRHFPTKQALFEAVIVARMRDLIADARDRDELHAALGELLTRAQQAGAVRADIAAADLAALLKGLLTTVQASADPGPPGRVLAVLCDGLRRFR